MKRKVVVSLVSAVIFYLASGAVELGFAAVTLRTASYLSVAGAVLAVLMSKTELKKNGA